MPRSIDECPASGCGSWVPGVEDPVFEGNLYTCRRGHTLVARVIAGRAHLAQDRRGLEDAASKIAAMPKRKGKRRG